MDLTVFFLGCSLDTLYFGFDAILIKCAHTMHACSYIYIYMVTKRHKVLVYIETKYVLCVLHFIIGVLIS
jgi:hypothetical protein